MQKLSGIILLLSGLIALLISNSPIANLYFNFVNIQKPFNVLFLVNDILMTIFFLDVGLEIKQQMVYGHLSKIKAMFLPLFAASGGVILPAIIFYSLNLNDPVALKGWAIPTATDIAFALGVFMLLGSRMPLALRAILLSIAVLDDLLAIVIISLFYSSNFSVIWLLLAFTCILGLVYLNKSNKKNLVHYLMLGGILWLCMLSSGIHPTMSGVITALLIPMSIQQNLHKKLSNWVRFVILPIFAFTNSGISLQGIEFNHLLQPVPLGIALGLLLGKQIGIFSFAWLSIKAKIAAKPKEISWPQLYGMAIICGIGFTMSIFIANLAYDSTSITFMTLSKLGILTGSILAAILGYVFLRVVR